VPPIARTGARSGLAPRQRWVPARAARGARADGWWQRVIDEVRETREGEGATCDHAPARSPVHDGRARSPRGALASACMASVTIDHRQARNRGGVALKDGHARPRLHTPDPHRLVRGPPHPPIPPTRPTRGSAVPLTRHSKARRGHPRGRLGRTQTWTPRNSWRVFTRSSSPCMPLTGSAKRGSGGQGAVRTTDECSRAQR